MPQIPKLIELINIVLNKKPLLGEPVQNQVPVCRHILSDGRLVLGARRSLLDAGGAVLRCRAANRAGVVLSRPVLLQPGKRERDEGSRVADHTGIRIVGAMPPRAAKGTNFHLLALARCYIARLLMIIQTQRANSIRRINNTGLLR